MFLNDEIITKTRQSLACFHLHSAAWNSGAGKGRAWAYATCCNSSDADVNIECDAVWSEQLRDFVNVTCPAGSFMAGCNGALSKLNYFIDKNILDFLSNLIVNISVISAG